MRSFLITSNRYRGDHLRAGIDRTRHTAEVRVFVTKQQRRFDTATLYTRPETNIHTSSTYFSYNYMTEQMPRTLTHNTK